MSKQFERKWFINVAVSFDGKIGAIGKQIRMSSEEDWKMVHQLRNKIVAVAIGGNTVNIDNPSLLTKPKYLNSEIVHHPLRIIFDRRGIANPNSKVFLDQEIAKTIWITSSSDEIKDVIKIKVKKNYSAKKIKELLDKYLDSQQITGDIMLEGGSSLINSFLESNLISSLRIYRSPLIIPDGKPLFPKPLNVKLLLQSVKRLGDGQEEYYAVESM